MLSPCYGFVVEVGKSVTRHILSTIGTYFRQFDTAEVSLSSANFEKFEFNHFLLVPNDSKYKIYRYRLLEKLMS